MAQNELYHYGVKGMKWGQRKAVDPADVKASRRTRRLAKALDRQRNVAKSWDDAGAITDKRGKTIYSKSEVKEIRDAAYERVKKMEVKLLKSQMRDQINAGESAVGRLYNKVTGADKYEADMLYDLNKRSRVNKKYS